VSHDYHDGLPGFSAAQILHDGCGECEARAASPEHGIGNLDRGNFVRAWHRAAEWNTHGLPDVAEAEVPMLRVLWAVQLKLENLGVPIGTLPVSLAAFAGEQS
jgi:hypothetical protein